MVSMTWVITDDRVVMFGTHTLESEGLHSCCRDLDVVELWSGVGSIACAGRAHGNQCQEFDLERLPGVTDIQGPGQEDITTPLGFRKALELTQRLREGGLLWLAPLCSSFVFPDSSRTQRKAGQFDGNQVIARGNRSHMTFRFQIHCQVPGGTGPD